MATRQELLNDYEAKLMGFIIRCDAYKHPVTGKLTQRNKGKQKNKPDCRSAIIEVEESPDGTHVLERHITFWWDSTKHVKGNVQFYVLNPGQPDEEAIWLKAQDPLPPTPEPEFQQRALACLRGTVGQTVAGKTIKHVANVSADQQTQTATARVLIEEEGLSVWIDVYLWLNEQDAVQWELIPQSA